MKLVAHAVAGAKCLRVRAVGGLKRRALAEFKRVDTVLGNLKATQAATLHPLEYRKYADPCLAAPAYRFELRNLLAHLVVDVTPSKPGKEKVA